MIYILLILPILLFFSYPIFTVKLMLLQRLSLLGKAVR
jgi:hypothetical protein